MIETQRKIPYMNVEADEPVEIKEKKIRPHVLTQYARKKFPVLNYNKNY